MVLPLWALSAATSSTITSADRLTPVALPSPVQTTSRASTVARFVHDRSCFRWAQERSSSVPPPPSLPAVSRQRIDSRLHRTYTCHLSPVTIVPLPLISRPRSTHTRAHTHTCQRRISTSAQASSWHMCSRHLTHDYHSLSPHFDLCTRFTLHPCCVIIHRL
jgi:hypothetical protein